MKIKKVVTTTIDVETKKETVETSSWEDVVDEQPKVYWNTEQSYTAKCADGLTGNPVTSTIPANWVSSLISQDDADTQAKLQAKLEAEEYLICVPVVGMVTNNVEGYFKAECGTGFRGTPVEKRVAVGSVTSSISVLDANTKAQEKAVTEAKAELVCVPVIVPGPEKARFYSTAQTFTAKAPAGYECEDKTHSEPDKAFISKISVADANAKALRKCKIIAEGLVMRYMEQTTPTIKDGFNGSWGKGSIQKGSKDFIADFVRGKLNVGDSVGIETSGKYGQLGVGGAFPYKWFDKKADMSTNKTTDGKTVGANDYVGVLEDGLIYRYDANENSYAPFTEVLKEYLSKINPHGLSAKIVSITPTTGTKVKITLDKAAVITETNVKIYFDNYQILQDKAGKDATINLPAGKFYSTFVFEPNRYVFINFKGAGKDKSFLQSPKGFASMSLQMEGIWDVSSRPTHKAVVSDLTVIGNHGQDGFRFKEDEKFKDVAGYEYLAWINTRINEPSTYVQGICMASWYGTVKNCRVIDAIGYSIQSTVRGCAIDSNDVIQTEEVRTYMGWQIHSQGNVGEDKCIVSNNNLTCVKVCHGLEGFRTENVHFFNNVRVNGMMALNGTTDILVEDQTSDVSSTGLPDSDWFNSGYAHVTVNQLMGNSGEINFIGEIMNGAPFIENEKYNFPMQIHGMTGGYGTPNLKVYDSEHVCGDADIEGNFAPHSFMIDANGGLLKNCKSYHKMSDWMLDYPEDFLEKSTMGLNYPSSMYEADWNWKGGTIEDCECNIEGGTIRTVKGCKVINSKAALIVEGGKYNGE